MKPYPDFDLESPSPQPLGADGDYAGFDRFLTERSIQEAFDREMAKCGNRFIAHGRLVEMVSEVTGVKS